MVDQLQQGIHCVPGSIRFVCIISRSSSLRMLIGGVWSELLTVWYVMKAGGMHVSFLWSGAEYYRAPCSSNSVFGVFLYQPIDPRKASPGSLMAMPKSDPQTRAHFGLDAKVEATLTAKYLFIMDASLYVVPHRLFTDCIRTAAVCCRPGPR